jgi:hypothetical protein
MAFGRKTLIPVLALAITAAVPSNAPAAGPRHKSRADADNAPVAKTQAVSVPGCILKFSAVGAPIVVAGTDRDVMLAWSLITGSVRHRPSGRPPATTAHCPSAAASGQAPTGHAAGAIQPPHADDLAADGLKTGLRYHFGPKGTR